MDEVQIEGAGHRFALRDYYENVEIADARLWHLSDEELAAEKVRCEGKLAQAKKNMTPLGPSLWLLVGAIGVVPLALVSRQQFGWFGLIGALLWLFGMVAFPLRRFMAVADFERRVVKHYQDRLQLIRLIQRDRA